MSKYTTGEMAKLCGVTVRTVQYYDTRDILKPSELTEGGRRLYTEEDVKRMRIICFLREVGMSIDSIGQLLAEEDPSDVIELLIERQEKELKESIAEQTEKLNMLGELRKGLKSVDHFSVESIGDVANIMKNRNELKKVRRTMLLTGIPFGVLQWGTIALWIIKGVWQPFLLWVIAGVPYAIWTSRYYFRHIAYICPHCHEVFRPSFREMFFAGHTPTTRKLTCPKCGHRGFCVETSAEEMRK